ncbi:MAG: hypothetical protein HKUEN07_01380 [Rhodocyclaceae bacterium]|nr:hypothetical protein [Rhodocyclaceae bacterium]GIK46962.1 MAG: hypothetical protein BroJett012_28650 [Betaproteobacteria bacterium]GJQ53569.1 MAG: hypothetical protein HKUEN07_01380 [Rhodocyclaceae bacterium]
MKKLRTAIAIALALLSAYMVFNGLTIFVNTSGVVQGSEFGMLITLANQISLLMLWLSLFAFWRLVPSAEGANQG